MLKRICSHCGAFLGYVPCEKELDGKVSHGYCNDCLPIVFPEVYTERGTRPDCEPIKEKP